MYLKRLYHPAQEGQTPRVSGVRVLRLGRKQKFSPDLLARGQAEGWLVVQGRTLTLKHADGEVAFNIVRTPGYYCCHCGVAVGDGAEARVHIGALHAGQDSPDPESPSGYMRTHAYKAVQAGTPVLIGKGD